MFIQVAFPFGIKIEDVRIMASWKLPLGLGLINFFLVVKISHLNLFFSSKISALANSTKFLIKIFE